MLQVWKYPIYARDDLLLDMPQGAWILTVQSQGNDVCLWALVDPEANLETRRFRLAGTGQPIYLPPDQLHYINTFQLKNVGLVFHLFEVTADAGAA